MKKLLSVILVAGMLLSLCGCGGNTAPETSKPEEVDPNMPKKLRASQVTQFPLATDDMTKEQLRQLCIDFMELQVTAQWKTNTNVEFQMTNYSKGALKYLTTDEIYGGIFYHSKGFGNPYRWLEYYDEETGTMDMETAIAENGGMGEGAATTDEEYNNNGDVEYRKYRSLMTLGNQCSASTCWSWGRVINSVSFGDTCDMNVYNGYIPVGCYTYSYQHEGKTYDATTIEEFGVKSETNPLKYDTDDVIKDWNAANGSDAMFKCYAQLKPGDCLVSGGHTLMVRQVNLYITRDGEVDYAASTVSVLEQTEAWAHKGNINGVSFKQQGRDNYGYTFEQLQKEKYIPFTFLELLDPEDPQDKKHLDYYNSYADKLVSVKNRYSAFDFQDNMAGSGVEKAEVYCTYEGDSITFADFAAMTVGANYSISDVFVTVTDGSGTQLLKNIWRGDFSNYREVSMSDHKCSWETDAEGKLIPIYHGVEALANGENTVEVTLQLSTGEKLTAFTGTLNAN